MKHTISILLLMLIPVLSWATGMSWAWIKINPVAQTDQGELICKWVSQVNLSGASSATRYDLGWIVVSSRGVVYEYQSDSLDAERDGLSKKEKGILAKFTAHTTIAQIPEKVRVKTVGNISSVENSGNFYRRTAVPCDSIGLFDTSPLFYTIKGIRSDDYSGTMPTSSAVKYSHNGIVLKTTYKVDGYLHEFCPSFLVKDKPIVNASFFAKEGIEIYEIDAFTFSSMR